ncbi:diguanylate cyclase/phosphodiesterase (GGDEF & EAL domains) with PAS/PAC sensor(s) [hydrothermal vent metagenome]|uniref:Diguanylate cyclase/phosphodiesterase (GGDEF & EAL domains) with PAS/PAC sensor(S) n=1 Tax=hydrothermal vent metagenome TaxID=652676 RepID=A0A3B1AQ15_9ZZZZ
MKLLIAEDDTTSRLMLSSVTAKWGYEVVVVEDGDTAWKILQEPDAPLLLLLDWEMPGINGLQLCNRIRQLESNNPPYIILLTARRETNDIVAGLNAGANEYIAKPFDHAELKARLDVGKRMLGLQSELATALSRLQLTSSVFSSTHEGIIITDPKGCILEVNDAFTHITGYSRDEVLGKNPRILSSGHQGEAFYKAMWDEILNNGNWSGEIWNRRKNGEVYAETLSISAVADKQKNIEKYVAIFSDITIQKYNQKKLEHIAHHDALTDLPNRLLFADRLEQAMLYARRRKQCFALAYLDLDNFKPVNDTYGHAAGDQLLVTIAKRIKYLLRESDTLARLGGDEFVIIVNDLHHCKDSLPLITKILEAIAQPIRVGELTLHVTASIGISYYSKTILIDAEQLLKQADQAMYKAKQAGNNRYTVFDGIED